VRSLSCTPGTAASPPPRHMHAVEALTAATDATGDESLRERALGIARRVAHDFAAPPPLADPPSTTTPSGDRSWSTTPPARTTPSSRMGPPWATGWEWSRLAAAAPAGGAGPMTRPTGWQIRHRPVRAAAADGWAVDGADGFVYTTGWDGQPVVRDRMRWVLAEGFAAAAGPLPADHGRRYAKLAATWSAYAELPDRSRTGLLAPPAQRPE
jgi:sulfoquinovose isomerase